MSGVRCHMFFLYCFLTKWWSQLVEGLLSTWPTPSSFRYHCYYLLMLRNSVFHVYWIFGGELESCIELNVLGILNIKYLLILF